jgi:PmbA protein
VSERSEQLLDIADSIVSRAKAGEEVEAYVARSRETSVRARKGEVETLEQATSGGVGVRVIVDGKQGFAYVGSLDPTAVASALDDARDNAQHGTPDDANGLARPDGVEPAFTSVVDDALVDLEPARRVELALAIEAALLAADPRVDSATLAEFSDSLGEKAIVTTTGLRVTDRSTGCRALAEALAIDGADRFEAYAFDSGRRLADVDIDGTGRLAGERAAALIGAKKPESRRVTIVLDPWMASNLLGVIGSTLTGEAVLKGRSLFADRVGDTVAAAGFTLADDPTDPKATASTYDGEGLASRRTPLIEAGVLQGFLHASWSARKAKTSSTASATRSYMSTPSVSARALSLAPGTLSDDELLRAVGDAVYVQSMSGLHSGVNPVSGDFSVGITGRVVRDGALAEPIREATIASTIQRMLLDVVAVGADVQWIRGTGTPMLAIEGVSLSGS